MSQRLCLHAVSCSEKGADIESGGSIACFEEGELGTPVDPAELPPLAAQGLAATAKQLGSGQPSTSSFAPTEAEPRAASAAAAAPSAQHADSSAQQPVLAAPAAAQQPQQLQPSLPAAASSPHKQKSQQQQVIDISGEASSGEQRC